MPNSQCITLCVVLHVSLVLVRIHLDKYKRDVRGLPFTNTCAQGSENVCKLGLIINRMAAKNQTDKINKASKSGPEPVQSALDMTDSSDDEQ